MAHFYGRIKGSRGPASRLGGESSGFDAVAASWQGAVSVRLYCRAGVDHARVELIKWAGAGTERVLYDGPVDGSVIVLPKKREAA